MDNTLRTFKYVLIGNSGSGKSSLFVRFSDGVWVDSYLSTIGVDFRCRHITVDGERVKIQVWDTAGQERFHSITSAYYRGADAIIFVYDITSKETFIDMEKWMEDVNAMTRHNPPIKYLIGCKSDLGEERQVMAQEAKDFASSNNMSFLETSSKTSYGVEHAFVSIARDLCQKNTPASDKITLTQDKTKSGCCF